MNFRNRALAYAGAGAAGLFAAGAFAAPALAADEADVLVKPLSSKIAVGAELKIFRFDIKNAGPGVATDTTITFDISGLDPNKIDLLAEDIEGENVKVAEATEDEIVLEIGDGASGETLPFGLPIILKDGVDKGSAGSFKVSVKSTATDPDETNNSATIPVEVVDSGFDLASIAYDVRDLDGNPIKPGGTGSLYWEIANQGDQAVKGLTLSLTLPEKATFAEDYDGCVTSADRRVLTCEDPESVLEPGYVIDAGDGLPVTVSEDASGPVTLTGGLLKVTGGSAVTPPEVAALDAKASQSFGSFEIAPVDEEPPADVDPGDNDAEFAVFVGAADGGGGGGDGELPLTGVQAGLIGGVGLAALAGGGVLFLMARRRKVVLVAGDDEVPTA
ncbi:LPXTG cell wall anchor domain-containing protein [Phytohabitans rumicis]|uniref:LPXTG cell wall anchor domain-containing protein n=1 Tax=Phytohabitans rumicis TaxID=1076125 RepID=A0A6V8L1Y0_9ACTN|nr:LPXTG cell wall anchor domain-containing protein [Phytohabitans rumicis]GFJ90144.1 hypothetical protein Prum_037860 [Phytohabitans rumicis]